MLTVIGGLCCVGFINNIDVVVGVPTVNYRPVLSSERAPQNNKPATV
jgi:hypothetical protein